MIYVSHIVNFAILYLRSDLNVDWIEILRNEMKRIFMNKLNEAINRHIPLKYPRKKGKTPLNSETVESIKRKHRAWTKYEGRSKNTWTMSLPFKSFVRNSKSLRYIL
jgi:hypothetical protein